MVQGSEDNLTPLEHQSMFLTEPRPTPYDLHFSVLNVPVRVHPLFWLVALLMGFSGGSEPKIVLLWVVAVFISILVHEMGHAVVIRYFGWSPSVVLYSFGGLAIYNPYSQAYSGTQSRRRRSAWTQVIISFAGPLAGFLLAGLIIAGVILAGIRIPIGIGSYYIATPGNLLENQYIATFLFQMLFINIFWGLLNLMPIFPLDGGKIARELFVMMDGTSGVRNSLMLSLVTAIGLGVLGFVAGERFLPIFFAFMAISNYQELNGPNRFGGNPW